MIPRSWSLLIPALAIALAIFAIASLLSGCSISAGGWSLCVLDHTNLQLSVQHEHADPNAKQP